MVIALFAYVLMLVWQKKSTKQIRKFNERSLATAILAVYYFLLALYTIVFRPVYAKPQYHLELFWSYGKAMEGSSYLIYEIVLNYILLMPVGILLPVIKQKHSFRFTLLIGFLTSAVIECSQLIFRRGLFEFDDIIGNAIGCVLGYGVYKLIISIVKLRRN